MKHEPYVDVQTIADHLGVPTGWIYRRADLEGMPVHYVGRYRRYRISEVDEWIERSSSRAA